MSISSEISRIENAKAAIKEAIAAKGVAVPDTVLIDALAEYILQISVSTNADTVDGFHIAVSNNGTTPPNVISNTISFVYGG